LVCLSCLFIVPANAPRPIGYERAMECVLETRSASAYFYFDSASEYENFWRDYATWSYDEIYLSASNVGRDSTSQNLPRPDLEIYTGSGRSISSYQHPPYEYLRETYSGGAREYQRVSSVTAHWNATEAAGVVFWVAAGGIYFMNLVFGLVFWTRFMRHRQAEVLAAAYAVGDPGLHDKLAPLVKQRNAVLAWVVIPLSVIGLHMVLFPVLRSRMLAKHVEWERRSGLAAVFAPTPGG
jgi:hypothetical protein